MTKFTMLFSSLIQISLVLLVFADGEMGYHIRKRPDIPEASVRQHKIKVSTSAFFFIPTIHLIVRAVLYRKMRYSTAVTGNQEKVR